MLRTLLGLDHSDPRVVADPGPPLESPLLHKREHAPSPLRRDWVEVVRLYLDFRMRPVEEVARAEHRGQEPEVALAVLGWAREVRMEPGILYAYEQIDVTCRSPDLPVVVLQLGELPQSCSKINILGWQRYCPYGVR